METRIASPPGTQGQPTKQVPPSTIETEPKAETFSASASQDNELCDVAQVDNPTIALCFNASRALARAAQHETVVLVGARWGNGIDFKWAGYLTGLGLLKQLDKRSFQITSAGRACLEAHPKQPHRGIYGTSPNPQRRRARAQVKLVQLIVCQSAGKCFVCQGDGFREGDRADTSVHGRSRFSDNHDCPACGGAGTAPNTSAYRQWLAALKAQLQDAVNREMLK